MSFDVDISKRSPAWIKQYRDNRWLGLGDTTQIQTINPFDYPTREDIENPQIFLLNLMRQQKYFGFTTKTLFDVTLAPFQLAILRELWVRPFPMLIGCRGAGKSWILALYCMLRALFNQGSKIVIVGAAFRQSKIVFDYAQTLWENGHVYRDIVGPDKRNGPRRDVDRCTLRVGDSLIICLPLGDGTKIRGQRANIVIADEFASIPKDIFETVVRGFAAVSQGPVDKFKSEMKKLAMKEMGLWNDSLDNLENDNLVSNQTIISGTASYSFNPFCEYWKRYSSIVNSRGDPNRLNEIFQGQTQENFNWKDYSVIRLPVSSLPAGFMDLKQISHAKATIHIGTWLMEYGACWANDSNGFFRRSLVESCVVGRSGETIRADSCGEVIFNAVLRGQPDRHYVMAIDPASEQDNFSIVILECWPDHRRIVYCWTTTRARYKAKVKCGLTQEGDFYAYTARKIHSLTKLFQIDRIAVDSQGGGFAVIEALQDKDKLIAGERPILPVIDADNPKETDGVSGEHILEVITFSKADWVRDANHGMKKDFEDKALLFPAFDTAILALSFEEDKDAGRIKVDQADSSIEKLYDTLEDCVMEIEDLKDELATIVHSQTGTAMRDRWDTPETRGQGGRKGRLRKDRYSSLLMANMIGRTIQRTPETQEYKAMGGFAKGLKGSNNTTGAMWIASGPDGAWWAEKSRQNPGVGGTVVKRGGR